MGKQKNDMQMDIFAQTHRTVFANSLNVPMTMSFYNRTVLLQLYLNE